LPLIKSNFALLFTLLLGPDKYQMKTVFRLTQVPFQTGFTMQDGGWRLKVAANVTAFVVQRKLRGDFYLRTTQVCNGTAALR
jgi:hypothetical protein